MFKILLLILCWLPPAGLAFLLFSSSRTYVGKLNMRDENRGLVSGAENTARTVRTGRTARTGITGRTRRSDRNNRSIRSDRSGQADRSGKTRYYNPPAYPSKDSQQSRREYRGIGTGLDDYK